jgi:hypothetical protein
MAFTPPKIPPGLSWGTRGFRIGKSPSGRLWVSVGLPFGLRYTWQLGRRTKSQKSPDVQEEVIQPDVPELLESLPDTESANDRLGHARKTPSKVLRESPK